MRSLIITLSDDEDRLSDDEARGDYHYLLGVVHNPNPVGRQDTQGLLEIFLTAYELVVGPLNAPHAAAAAAPRSPVAAAAAAAAPRSPLAGAAAAAAPRSPLAGAAAGPRHAITAEHRAFRNFVKRNEYARQIINPESRIIREIIRGYFHESIVFGTPDVETPPTIGPSALPVERNRLDAIRNHTPHVMLTMSHVISQYKKKVGQQHMNYNQFFLLVECWKCRVIEERDSVIYESKEVYLMLPPCFPSRIVTAWGGTSIRFTNLAYWVCLGPKDYQSAESSDKLFPDALFDLLLFNKGSAFSSFITQTIAQATDQDGYASKLGIIDWYEDEGHEEEEKHVALIPYNVIALGWRNEVIPCDNLANTVADAFRI